MVKMVSLVCLVSKESLVMAYPVFLACLDPKETLVCLVCLELKALLDQWDLLLLWNN